ncbi:hypothetical protein BDZ89DRAFT_1067083 [Hymenopellis radicata]|nr:hypothetical protein BDZ89DRAFT_1067083 [Hymenopellis radicata]
MLSALKPIVFCILAGSLSVYIYYNRTQLLSSLTMASAPSTWKSRAHAHPSPSTYSPTYASLALLAMRDMPAIQNSLTLAVFTDKVAITASGEVVVLSSEDYDAIMSLAEQAKALPLPDSFAHTWRVKHPMTSRPIDRVRLGTPGAVDMHQFAVYGYDSEKKELKEPVGDITHLPGELSELMELVLEGRADLKKDEINAEIVEKVKSIVPQAA